MSVWSGLGVNYKAAQTNWSTDQAYFNSIGLSVIRPNLLSIAYPWSVGTPSPGNFAFWRECAVNFANAGFYVTWGAANLAGATGQGQLTTSNWQNYHDSVVAEAQYCQQQGYIFGDFEVGNELDINVMGGNITQSNLVSLLQQLALDVKAVYSGKVSYAISGYGGETIVDTWNGGIGNFDVISVHPYLNIYGTQNYTYTYYANTEFLLNVAASYFGSNWYVSEFNLSGNNTNILTLTTEQQITQMRIFYSLLRTYNISKAIVYSWVGYLNGDNQFAMQNTDGSFNPVWDVLLGNDRRTFVP